MPTAMKGKTNKRKRNAAPPTVEELKSTFLEQLMNRFWAEKELEKLLPEVINQATSYELTTAITAHLATTRRQIIRLIHVFDSIEERAVGLRCETMTGLLKDSGQLRDQYTTGYPRDTAIILQCQKIMTHEITMYKSLHEQAVVLAEEVAASYLSVSIEEEKNANALLTEVALHSIYFDEAG
jgi:ferritin-like metal-binding protein YciE